MYGACCTIGHQQQQMNHCGTHKTVMMNGRGYCSLGSCSSTSHHSHDPTDVCSLPPNLVLGPYHSCPMPIVASFSTNEKHRGPSVNPLVKCTNENSEPLDKSEKKVNMGNTSSIFPVRRQNSKHKDKLHKGSELCNMCPMPGIIPQTDTSIYMMAHDCSVNMATNHLASASTTPVHSIVSMQNNAQKTTIKHQQADADTGILQVTLTLKTGSSSDTLTATPISATEPQVGQPPMTTNRIANATSTLSDVQMHSTNNAVGVKLCGPGESLRETVNKFASPDGTTGNPSSVKEPLMSTQCPDRSRRMNSAVSAASTGTDPRSRTCCFCWCCCFSCSCMRVRANMNDSHRLSSSNDPQSRGDNFSVDDVLTPEEAKRWGESFDLLMQSLSGRRVFREFLRSEYSEENMMFWLACEELKTETNPEIVEEKARLIYEDFISILSPKEVSLDSQVREQINANMIEPTPRTFDEAQLQIYTLMHRDSYLRFLNSKLYKELLLQQTNESYSDVATNE